MIPERLEALAWAELDAEDVMAAAIQEERWQEFTSELATARKLWTWEEILARVSDALAPLEADRDVPMAAAVFMAAVRDLADVEGKPAVLAAISDAWKAEELTAAEIERRR